LKVFVTDVGINEVAVVARATQVVQQSVTVERRQLSLKMDNLQARPPGTSSQFDAAILRIDRNLVQEYCPPFWLSTRNPPIKARFSIL